MSSSNDSGLTKATFPFSLFDTEKNETEFRASPLNDKKHDELDNWVRSRAIRNAQMASKHLSYEDGINLLDVAIQSSVGLSMFNGPGARVLMTPEGCAELCYQLIRDAHPDVRPEQLVHFFRFEDNVTSLGRVHKLVNPSLHKTIDGGSNKGSEGNE